MACLLKSLVLVGMGLLVSGCALDRGAGLSCTTRAGDANLVAQSPFDPTRVQGDARMLPDDRSFAPSMADAFRQTAEAPVRRVKAKAKRPIEIDVLALSAGGQYGAFGAGFLHGWAQNPVTPRPNFDLVTGVSAGGMLAPVAFAAKGFDAHLQFFRGLHEDGVFKRRGILALPAAASLVNAQPLEKMLKNLLSDALIESVADQHARGARLLVLATNLDTTRAEVFDLGEIASADRPVAERRDCMAEILLASAAIPGVFAPRNIDGTLYVDGGLRDQVFLREVESARSLLAQQTGRPVKVNATIVINGSLKAPEGPVDDRLFRYAERSLFVLSDEVLRDSIAETLTFAQRNKNWTVKGVIADVDLGDTCPQSEAVGTFDRCVTTALFDTGLAQGKTAPVDFMTSAELYALAAEF